jgi:GNAT superfamily N-acetyltransferase
MTAKIRPAIAADAEACGHIIFEAFKGIAEKHGFPPDFPSVEAATQLATIFIADPSIYGVVAEMDGRVVGSNFLTEGDPIRGVGPITVDPSVQGSGIGRLLMEAVVERARDAIGTRLVQDAFNTRSIAIYALVGFDVKEPLFLMRGTPRSRLFTPFVVEHEGRITGYLSAATFWLMNHGVAETEQDIRELIVGAASMSSEPVSFLLPTRQASFFRWCLGEGMRVVKPTTLMTMGTYQEPKGCYFPSVLY